MEHVLLSFALYTLNVLLPIIPTVVIYRLFPETTVTVSGPLARLTINASGAFAAYIITVALGYGLVSSMDARIDGLSSPTWEVTAEIAFEDNGGQPIRNPHGLVKDLKVMVDPPLEQWVYPEMRIRLPLVKPDHWPTLVLHVPGFHEQPVNLAKEDTVRDALKGSISLKRQLVLQQLPRAAAETPYTGNGPAILPLNGGLPENQ